MKTIIFIFLSISLIAGGQNKNSNTAIRDFSLKIPEGYTKRKWVESYPTCGTPDYTLVPNAENYDYNFYKKGNKVYCQGKLTAIDGYKFQQIWLNYYKNLSNVYYYTREVGLQRIPDINPASTAYFNFFIADKNYLYIKTSKVIERQNLKLISEYTGYKEPISSKNTDKNTYVNYYLYKNNKGYWIVKISNIISYNFLGKIYSPKWDIVYEKGKDDNGNLEDNMIYNPAGIDVKPEFKGGINKFYNFVDKNFKLEEKDIKGKIYATFVIEKDGSLSDVKILRDLGYGSGKELIRVLKLSPEWSPGITDGKKIRCLYSIPYTVNTSLD